MTHTLRVELGPRSYDVVTGSDLLEKAGRLSAPLLRAKRVIIVTDVTVAPLYLASLEVGFERAGVAHQQIILSAGEQTKSFHKLERLLTQLLDMKPDRKTTLVALGGGVIGDITGFAASILLRGVDFIQVPTTLLAQVDSSIGGKTGINMAQGKNLIGSFHQPRLVLSDTGTLASLSRRELLAGYAEVVKYGIINDAPFFEWLEANGAAALAGDQKLLAHMVNRSCEAKARIVTEDERESGRRMLLNFGHTLGHAFEAEAGFGDRLLHGEAVALGMVLAFKLSVMRGLCEQKDCERVEQHLKSEGLPTRATEIMGNWNIARLVEHCAHDKKATAGGLTFILAQKIGKTVISHDVRKTDLEELLAQALQI